MFDWVVAGFGLAAGALLFAIVTVLILLTAIVVVFVLSAAVIGGRRAYRRAAASAQEAYARPYLEVEARWEGLAKLNASRISQAAIAVRAAALRARQPRRLNQAIPGYVFDVAENCYRDAKTGDRLSKDDEMRLRSN